MNFMPNWQSNSPKYGIVCILKTWCTLSGLCKTFGGDSLESVAGIPVKIESKIVTSKKMVALPVWKLNRSVCLNYRVRPKGCEHP